MKNRSDDASESVTVVVAPHALRRRSGRARERLGTCLGSLPLFDLRKLDFIDAWLKKVVWGRLEGCVNILGYLGGHCGSLEAPFGLILALLGRLLDPFWLSWDVLGHLGTPFSPKLAQVGPRYQKKPRYLNLSCEVGLKLGAKNQEKSMPRTTFFYDAFLTSIFIDF